VQTFLPYPDFAASAATLDRARLGKQRVETFQLLRALTLPTYGWKNHPATRMWRGYVPALTKYGLVMTDAWIDAGFSDTVRPQLIEFAPEVDGIPEEELEKPPWFGDEGLHLSHRSNLIRKNPEHYLPLFPGTPPDLPYVWPVGKTPLD
jgi:Pyrimidine dimer DNA glycosylase